MNPTLKDGEVVLVDREAAKIEIGDIVVAKHPVEQTSEIVKRVERINERGHYFLIGDNLDDSNDSRHFGAVTKNYIKGKVVARLRK
jgi:nickel-type superoxide dismutase maturation protease